MEIDKWIQTGVVVGAAIWWLIRKIFQKKEPHSLNDTIKDDIVIYDFLADLLFEYNAIRSYVIQFHNGAKYYSGQPIQRLTVSHEKVRPGIKKIMPDHDGILVSMEIHDVVREMRKYNDGFYYCPNREHIMESKPELYTWMRDNGVMCLLYIELKDTKTNDPIGILGMHWNYTDGLNEGDDDPKYHSGKISVLRQSKRQIETIFDKL